MGTFHRCSEKTLPLLLLPRVADGILFALTKVQFQPIQPPGRMYYESWPPAPILPSALVCQLDLTSLFLNFLFASGNWELPRASFRLCVLKLSNIYPEFRCVCSGREPLFNQPAGLSAKKPFLRPFSLCPASLTSINLGKSPQPSRPHTPKKVDTPEPSVAHLGFHFTGTAAQKQSEGDGAERHPAPL